MSCIHGEDNCVRCAMEDLPKPTITPEQSWQIAVNASGAGWGRDVDGISPWHDGCPTGCMPCTCKSSDIWLNRGKPHFYSHKAVCIFCGHSKKYIEGFGVRLCSGCTLLQSHLQSLSGLRSQSSSHSWWVRLKDRLSIRLPRISISWS